MNRKEFIKLAAFSGALMAVSNSASARHRSKQGDRSLTVGELQQFLTSKVSLSPDTVDRIIIGDPDTTVRKIGTCWMSTWDICKKAVNAGVNVLITHEPTFYTHRDLDEVPGFLMGYNEYTQKQ
ncbi:MAG: hypothetical protein EHM72_14425, partial [Calditrichaeota bacterium]